MSFYVKAILLGCAATAAIIVAKSKALEKKAKIPTTPVASSSTQSTTDDIAAANATSELKHKLFIIQKDRDILIAEVATLKEDLVSARAAADATVETTRTQIESERKALKTKLAALEAELKTAQTELAALHAENAKRKSLFGRLF